MVEFIVSTDGTTEKEEILYSSNPIFNEAAIKAFAS